MDTAALFNAARTEIEARGCPEAVPMFNRCAGPKRGLLLGNAKLVRLDTFTWLLTAPGLRAVYEGRWEDDPVSITEGDAEALQALVDALPGMVAPDELERAKEARERREFDEGLVAAGQAVIAEARARDEAVARTKGMTLEQYRAWRADTVREQREDRIRAALYSARFH